MTKTTGALVILAGVVSIFVGAFVLTICLSTGVAPGRAPTVHVSTISNPRR